MLIRSDPVATSAFEEFRRDAKGRFIAVEAIEKLIAATRARYVILSYSSGGRATASAFERCDAASRQLLDVVAINYQKNVMAGMTWTHEWLREVDQSNREFLFLLESNVPDRTAI